MKQIKPLNPLTVFTLVKYEAVSYCGRRQEKDVFNPQTERYETFIDKVWVYRHKEMWRKTFTSIGELREFLRNSIEARRYKCHARRNREGGWLFTKTPEGFATDCLCITEGPLEIPDGKPVQTSMPWYYNPGKRRKAGRRYLCDCWYCRPLSFKLDPASKKGRDYLQKLEQE